MRDVAAVILAAGGSSRLGRPKQLVEFEGQALVRRAVETATSVGCGPVIVVVGRDAAACRRALAGTAAVLVDNPHWQDGLGTSIRAGFAAVPSEIEAAVLMLCDQPRVTADTLRRLDAAARDAAAPVAVAEYAATVGPPVRVAGDALVRLRTWPSADGAKRLWQDAPAGVCRVACAEAATDVDTEADVAALGRADG